MRFFKAAASIIIFLASTFALAKDKAESEIKVNVIEKTVVRGSSEHNRLNIKNSVLVQLVGAGPSPGSATGMILAHYLDSDRIIQLEVLNTKSNWQYYGTWGSRTDISGLNLGIHFKQHTGNSFYFKGGADYSAFDYNYKYVSYSGTAYDEGYSFKGRKVSASVAIGNQWQWENFTLGCDWIGWSVPITYSTSDEKSYGNNTSNTATDLRSTKEIYLQNGYPLALHFYLGASF